MKLFLFLAVAVILTPISSFSTVQPRLYLPATPQGINRQDAAAFVGRSRAVCGGAHQLVEVGTKLATPALTLSYMSRASLVTSALGFKVRRFPYQNSAHNNIASARNSSRCALVPDFFNQTFVYFFSLGYGMSMTALGGLALHLGGTGL